MSQYQTGTVSVTNGDATVTGSGTSWDGVISAGDLFKVNSDSAHYTVASVTSDTELELTANYAGTTGSGKVYNIVKDFTTNYDLPEITAGDKNWPYHLTQALRTIDSVLADFESRIAALEP